VRIVIQFKRLLIIFDFFEVYLSEKVKGLRRVAYMNKMIFNEDTQTLQDFLENASSIDDRGIVIVNGREDEIFTYFDLYACAKKFTCYIYSLGMNEGDELIINIENIREFLICFWGCILGGIIAVPISHKVGEDCINKVINVWGKLKRPKIVTSRRILDSIANYCDNETASRIREGFVESDGWQNIDSFDFEYKCRPEKIAFIQFSSGSTGNPKGVILTHRNLVTNVKAIVKNMEEVAGNGSCSWLPLTHDMGLIGFHLSPLYLKTVQVLMMPLYFIKNPMAWLNKVCQYKCSVINSPNFGYEYFLKMYNDDNDLDLSNIRLIFNGAEPINYDLCQRFLSTLENKKLGKKTIFPVYGMAEASLAITFPPVEAELEKVSVDRNYLNIGDEIKVVENEANSGSVTFVKLGQAVDNCNYRITNADGIEVAERKVGNIEIKGENVTSGYYNNIEDSRQTFTDDGWLKTGDIGFNYEGSLVIVGRTKEIIIINGINYYPADIETMVSKCIGISVTDVVAVGAMDYSRNTEFLIVFVKFKGRMSDFYSTKRKVDNLVKIVLDCEVTTLPISLIPKTTSGKARRVSLKKRYENGEFADIQEQLEQICLKIAKEEMHTCILTSTEKAIVEIFKSEFAGTDISINDSFIDYGINSMHLNNILNAIKESFPDNKFDASLLYKYQTIKEIAEFIDTGNMSGDKMTINDIDMILKDL